MAIETQMDPKVEMYAQMFLIRQFENTILSLFDKALLYGTTHTSIGQEHVAVACNNNIDKERDIVFSNHRCHGHFLAYSDDPYSLACELMGRKDGLNRGIGGSQHLHFRNFYSNGILGGTIGNAVGMAFAEKRKQSNALTTVFLGDGALGEGIVYEAFNLASLWQLPIVFVVEANKYAQSTPTKQQLAGEFASRFRAFGICALETETTDPWELNGLFRKTFIDARKSQNPVSIIVHTYRLGPHSKSDDHRDREELDSFWKKDPMAVLRSQLNACHVEAIEGRVSERVRETFAMAQQCEPTRVPLT